MDDVPFNHRGADEGGAGRGEGRLQRRVQQAEVGARAGADAAGWSSRARRLAKIKRQRSGGVDALVWSKRAARRGPAIDGCSDRGPGVGRRVGGVGAEGDGNAGGAERGAAVEVEMIAGVDVGKV